VYALSQRGASDEAARWLAERENASDLIGGVSLEDKDDLVASVLLDLSQTGTIAASLRVGKRVLHQLSRVGRIHKNHVMQAGFAVLKSPDIPSILVETAFISNPREERKLANPAHQRDIASAVLAGVQNYFLDNPPPGTLVAQIARGDGKGMLKHVIARGDTLTGIAQEYNVSLQSLRRANQIEGDMLRAGDVLYIPLHHQS
jgi:N-acetylmuramoyl-L-alanine amidase